MGGRSWSKSCVLLLTWLGSVGCYSYVPTQAGVVPAGEGVRLRVTRDGARELAEVTAVSGGAPEIIGEVVGRERSDLLVRVQVAQRREGIHFSSLGQTIRVPTDEILSVERREFDGILTALFVTGGVAAATGVLLGVIEAFGRPADNGDGTDPPDFFIGLFSIPIG